MDFDEEEDEDYGFDDEITDEGPEFDNVLKTIIMPPLDEKDLPEQVWERER
jgi:hypothetical protein